MLEIHFFAGPLCPGLEILMTIYARNSLFTAPLCPGLEIFRDFDNHLCLKLAICSTPLSRTRDFLEILTVMLTRTQVTRPRPRPRTQVSRPRPRPGTRVARPRPRPRTC